MDRYGHNKGHYYSNGPGGTGGGGGGGPRSGPKSRYTLFVENVSSMTPKKDLVREMERIAGTVLAAAKDDRKRTALVEFRRTSDADYAYRKAHGVRMDGRRWEVRWASRDDFRDFGWKWTEGGYESDEDDRDTGHYNNTTSPVTRDRSSCLSPNCETVSLGHPPELSVGRSARHLYATGVYHRSKEAADIRYKIAPSSVTLGHAQLQAKAPSNKVHPMAPKMASIVVDTYETIYSLKLAKYFERLSASPGTGPNCAGHLRKAPSAPSSPRHTDLSAANISDGSNQHIESILTAQQQSLLSPSPRLAESEYCLRSANIADDDENSADSDAFNRYSKNIINTNINMSSTNDSKTGSSSSSSGPCLGGCAVRSGSNPTSCTSRSNLATVHSAASPNPIAPTPTSNCDLQPDSLSPSPSPSPRLPHTKTPRSSGRNGSNGSGNHPSHENQNQNLFLTRPRKHLGAHHIELREEEVEEEEEEEVLPSEIAGQQQQQQQQNHHHHHHQQQQQQRTAGGISRSRRPPLSQGTTTSASKTPTATAAPAAGFERPSLPLISVLLCSPRDGVEAAVKKVLDKGADADADRGQSQGPSAGEDAGAGAGVPHLPLEYEALMEAHMDDLIARGLIHWTPEQLVEDALQRAFFSPAASSLPSPCCSAASSSSTSAASSSFDSSSSTASSSSAGAAAAAAAASPSATAADKKGAVAAAPTGVEAGAAAVVVVQDLEFAAGATRGNARGGPIPGKPAALGCRLGLCGMGLFGGCKLRGSVEDGV
ncbi:hypothetical protein VOLCADRAFT_107746 [Volvox carteri f. nagariensis]|uniref:RRM domain-containing protein n=1 Tax=Volvox carteri f. nagariensis TaxID=3068 RepID=D8UG14_VOLCA|nr:uncharacterized protein VOLCADRAFT_107746 [Volvox carteri f. nagariensis]EFJ41350.1 hypothetical protein VOLCADRAFT_107746 [Volvox carteri f. nagariensis]|eukprot:XP_002957580.1 hypothetical protein VOLCADRAFT_107746 [Volvox carteri f. nagariensis]